MDYARHTKTNNRKREETCRICGKTFTNLSNYKYHMDHHSEERPWSCDECMKSYKTKVDLIQHKRSHDRGKQELCCLVCGEIFSAKAKFNAHVKIHTRKGPQKCEICGGTFKNLRTHIRQVHEKMKNHTCSICDKSFGSKYGLTRHALTVHSKLRPWSCDKCQASFGAKNHLLRHRNIHFREEQMEQQVLETIEPFDDSYVKREESQEFIEEIYVTSNDPENDALNEEYEEGSELEGPYLEIERLDESEMEEVEVLDEYRDLLPKYTNRCNVCSITFKSLDNYRQHVKSVHNKQPISCRYCGETFLNRVTRMRHLRRNHPEALEDNIAYTEENKEELANRTCMECNKVFKKPEYLELHAESVHDIKRLFECEFCQRQLKHKDSMERHIKTVHLGIKNFKCKERACGKVFRSNFDLNEHFKSIHKQYNGKMFICDVCDKVCTTKKLLNSHKRCVHEKVRYNNTFECKICFEMFDTKYKKEKHITQVHQNGKSLQRVCHFCSAAFDHCGDFLAHIHSHDGCFICDICGHNFDDDNALHVHKLSHKRIEVEFRQFICDMCGHLSSTKSQLEIHMRKHFSENHYVCAECGKSYKYESPFLYHLKKHKN